jgi:glycosidase
VIKPHAGAWESPNRDLIQLFRGVALVKKLLHYRRKHPSLHNGAIRLLSSLDDMLVYERVSNSDRVLVALNFSSRPRRWAPPQPSAAITISTHGDRREEAVGSSLELRGNERHIIRLNSTGSATDGDELHD